MYCDSGGGGGAKHCNDHKVNSNAESNSRSIDMICKFAASACPTSVAGVINRPICAQVE